MVGVLGFVLCALWAQKPFVVPEVQEWTAGDGTFELLSVKADGKVEKTVAQQFVNDCKWLNDNELNIHKGSAKKGDLVLKIVKDKTLGAEGYKLDITTDKAILTAANETALRWGVQTVLQLMEQKNALPCGVIKDLPQYGLRGFMIDCGRKFIPIDYLHDLVRAMAYYKMNTLQIHLNDNGFKQFFGNDWDKTPAAFRVECDTYPGLAARDGYYTKKEFVELQKYAESLGVEIIPEIDVPAHCLAFTHYKPELASDKYGADHLDLFKDETYEFFDKLFAEYLGGKEPVFRGRRVNIGTDEYSNADKEVVEKFRAFTDHYLRLVQSYGKQACCWGALTHAKGDTPVTSENVVMNIWYNGYAHPKEMQKLGYQLVSIPDGYVYIVPAAGYYYDYLNIESLYKNWTPAQVGNVKFDEQDPSLLGGMFAVWNDHCGNGITVADIHHRTMPALQTLSTKCWTGQNTTIPFEVFNKKRHELSEAPFVNQLARARQNGHFAEPGSVVLEKAEVNVGEELPMKEIGYNYAVTFTVEAQKEDKGTVLFASPTVKFYLADPKEGKIGFEREGYLNTFNYRLPEGEKVTLRIEGDNCETRLFVNDRHRETLNAKTLYAFKNEDLAHFQDGDETAWKPVMYAPTTKMNYQRTLVFPLQKVGAFKSKITNLQVKI